MKKVTKIIIILVAAVVLFVAAFLISRAGGSKLANGTYHITNSEAYPDAYIVVDGNQIQFYNIDLNALYRDDQMENYRKLVERGSIPQLTEEQLEQVSDLNALFVTNPWEMNYDEIVVDKRGTFTYVYFCMVKDTFFGKVLQYNSLHRTIQINDENPEKVLIFKE